MTPSRPTTDPPSIHRFDAVRVFRRLAEGATLDDLLHEAPGLSPDDLRTCFAYAAEVLANAAPPTIKNETIAWAAPNASESATLPPPVTAEAATLAPAKNVIPSSPAKRISLPGYEILGKLGEGGMGVVYKARHLRLNRLVAIKMILAGEHASEEMIARFALEAEAVAQLQHPGIVQIHEIGEHDGHSFLTLEYVPGGSLAARLDDKPWPPEKAAELVETLARSMQAAHEHGIVHRDLKPENVLLMEPAGSANGQMTPKITDFGLAKRLQETTGRTRTGEVMGTPSYMAPEQAAGKRNIGPAADIHALGAILYRLLVGHPPFVADTALDTMMLVLEQEPAPLRSVNKKLPRDLETIALKCLAKEPAKRYASAMELADDLRRFLDGEPIAARRVTPRQRFFGWCRKRPGAALARGVLILLLLAFAIGVSIMQGIGMGLAMLAWIGSTLLVFTAVTRTRLRPFLIGLALALVLPIVIGIGFKVLAPNAQLAVAGKGGVWSYFVPDLNGDNVGVFACLLPWMLGLMKGLFSRGRSLLLGVCFTVVFLYAVLLHPQLGGGLMVASIISLYFGIICRVVRWHCEGNVTDTLVGSLWGTGIGYFIAAAIFGCMSVGLFQNAANDPNALAPVMVVLVILCTLAGLFGSILGAYLGAIIGKRVTRRGRV